MFDAFLVVLSVFGVIGLGYVARLARYVTDRMGDGLSEYVNDIAIPFLIFQTLSSAKIPEAQPWGYWASYFAGVAIVWSVAMWIAGRFFHYGHLPRVVAGFAAGQANTVLVGIPLILKAFGKAGEVPLFLLIAIHLPITMTAATVLAEGGQVRPMAIVSRLARHPILIALALGALARLVQLPVAEMGPLRSVLDMVAASAAPCALLSMGIAMRRYGLQAGIALPAIVTTLKIVVHPLIVYLLAVKLFAIDPVWAGVATLFAACPCGINAYLLPINTRRRRISPRPRSRSRRRLQWSPSPCGSGISLRLVEALAIAIGPHIKTFATRRVPLASSCRGTLRRAAFLDSAGSTGEVRSVAGRCGAAG